MKTQILKFSFMLILVLSGFGSNAQSCSVKAGKEEVKKLSELKGEWVGEYVENGKASPMLVKISENNGSMDVQIFNESKNQKDLKASLSVCAPGKYHFFGMLPDGQEFRYNPRLMSGELAGTFQVGAVCARDPATFKLKKKI
jgi:hypothetical protein